MPRVRVVIQVLNDDESMVAESGFFIGENETSVLLEEVFPEELAQDLREIFTASLHEQYPNPGFENLSSPEPSELFRELLYIRLAHFNQRPNTPETRAAIQRELEAFRAEYPEQTVLPPSEDLNAWVQSDGTEFRLTWAHVLNPPYGSPHHSQAPASPDESNPVSWRVRDALREVVGERLPEHTQLLNHLSEQGMLSEQRMVSRRTLLAHFGLTPTSTRQELEEALGRQNQVQPPPDPVRGGHSIEVMQDPAAHFYVGTPVFPSDRHVDDPPTDHQNIALGRLVHAVYGGDPYRRSFPPEDRTKRGPPPPEDRTTIPTRYRRKPVI